MLNGLLFFLPHFNLSFWLEFWRDCISVLKSGQNVLASVNKTLVPLWSVAQLVWWRYVVETWPSSELLTEGWGHLLSKSVGVVTIDRGIQVHVHWGAETTTGARTTTSTRRWHSTSSRRLESTALVWATCWWPLRWATASLVWVPVIHIYKWFKI